MRTTLLLLGFAVLLAAMPPSANGSGVSDFDEAVAILAVIEGLECDWQCGLNCPAEDQHDLYASRFGNDDDLDLGEHWCMEFQFGCATHTCGGGSEEPRLLPAQLKELEGILVTAPPSELVALMAQTNGLEFNSERGAAQVIGCDDLVILSVPLNDDVTTALTEAE